MRFNTPAPQMPEPPIKQDVKIGNVYPAKGGRGNTKFWIVIARHQSAIVMLGLDAEGEVVSSQTYGFWSMEDRPVLGFCAGIEQLNFDIEWRQG